MVFYTYEEIEKYFLKCWVNLKQQKSIFGGMDHTDDMTVSYISILIGFVEDVKWFPLWKPLFVLLSGYPIHESVFSFESEYNFSFLEREREKEEESAV